MRKLLIAILFAFCGLLTAGSVQGQIISDPTSWKIEAVKIKGNEYDVVFRMTLAKGWHIWSLHPGGDGLQVSPAFALDSGSTATITDSAKEEGHSITEMVDGVDGEVTFFHDSVTYHMHIKVPGNGTYSGEYSYQVCDDKMCLPPKYKTFSVEIKDAEGGGAAASTQSSGTSSGNTEPENNGQKQSLFWLFLASLGGGIAAVITPCVYSMIPITVSFFTKRSKTRKEGVKNALYYSLSIIIIFTILGIAISAIFGANALNALSTNWIANLFFFAIFVLFGISFLGAFEISLPSSWTNKTDSKAGVGSFGGIFFMALTLAIVSFSCTGPIVGPLLVLAGQGGIAGPAVGMFGFSVGLALPFAIFAIFPGMLNKMATSGGWLNQVKVVLGFLEMMLALKFLSNADLAMGWRLLDREIFIALWIVIATLLGFYLLGKLKLSHDDAPAKNLYGQEYVSIFKLFLAIASFAFSVYLLPGMWGAPLNGVSAFLPPMGTFDSFGGGGSVSMAEPTDQGGIHPVKYVKDLKTNEPPVVRNYGLVTYFDYDEAIAASKELKKPIMLDFTGINCANCRKMESQVWSNPEVATRLKNNFIIASLYCDVARIKLPEAEQYFSKYLNATVKSLGDKNSDLQATKFGSNSQPYYFYIDEAGNKLAEKGYSYNPDVAGFIAHLDSVKARFDRSHP